MTWWTWSKRIALWSALCLPCVELGMDVWQRAHVVEPADWDAAVTFVRGELQRGDALVVTPAWADPILRWKFGDVMSVADAARSDLVGYERLWAIEVYGSQMDHPSRGTKELQRSFAKLRVTRWRLDEPAVRFDFVEHIAEARVHMTAADGPTPARDCVWQGSARSGSRHDGGGGGGLSAGPYVPGKRFVCDAQRPWLWVGRTVMEDLHLQPRDCVWQHPAEGRVVVTRFANVPPAQKLILHAGLYYEHERSLDHGPVVVEVWLGGTKLGELVHRDGDGWARREFALPEAPEQLVSAVEVRVHAPDTHLRTLCWNMKAVGP